MATKQTKWPLIALLLVYAIPFIAALIVSQNPHKYLSFKHQGTLHSAGLKLELVDLKDLTGTPTQLFYQNKKWHFIYLDQEHVYLEVLQKYQTAIQKYQQHLAFATAKTITPVDFNAALINPEGQVVFSYQLNNASKLAILRDIKRIMRNLYAT